MGTSKSNNGPKPNIPLLPNWAEDTEKEDNDTNQKGDWSNAKSWLTSATKANAGDRSRQIREAGRSYVRNSGGASSLSKSASTGRKNASRLGALLAGIGNEGLGETFQKLGLGDVSEMSVETAFAKLAEAICSEGGTIEESVANAAIVDALSELYELVAPDDDLERLEKFTSEEIGEFLEKYITHYIYERWLHELGMSIEKSPTLNDKEVIELEKEIFETISSNVRLEFKGHDLTKLDFHSGIGKTIVDRVFLEAYEMIEL